MPAQTDATEQMIIRPVAAGDEARWRVLWAAYIRFYRGMVTEEATANTWAEMLRPDGAFRCLIAERGGEVMGICHYLLHGSTWSTQPICYLQDLFVDPAARGSGAARALIEACEQEARRLGCFRLYWLTQEYNGAARSLYDSITPRSSFIVYRKGL